jgi:hypothetical protein
LPDIGQGYLPMPAASRNAGQQMPRQAKLDKLMNFLGV